MENSQALVAVPESPLALMPVMSVEQAVQRYEMMIDVVRKLLREGTDFGVIPGTEKPTLYKAGAEKLCTFFGLQAHFVLLDSTEDWEGGFFYYRYQCRLKRGEWTLAAAEGSANSREKKYRWRTVPDFKATKEEKATAVRREERTSRTGNKFAMLTIENSEPFDLVNTLQKMAQKRSLLASTLLAVNASEFFTQDLEDFADSRDTDDVTSAAAPRNNKPAQPRATAASAPTVSAEEATLNAKLLAQCKKDKGDKNGAAFFESVYAKKSISEKAELVKSLGLADTSAKPAEPEPPVEAADASAEIIEAKPLGADHGKVLDLIEAIKELGQTYDAINGKIAALCGGIYAVEELDDAQAAKVASALAKWAEQLRGGK